MAVFVTIRYHNGAEMSEPFVDWARRNMTGLASEERIGYVDLPAMSPREVRNLLTAGRELWMVCSDSYELGKIVAIHGAPEEK